MNRIHLTSAAFALSLLAAAGCDKKAGGDDEATKGGAKVELKTADKKKAAAKPAAPAKPIALTSALDVGAAVKDADDTRYKGMKMMGPAGASVVDSGMGLTVKWGKVQFEFRNEFEDEGAVAKAKKSVGTDGLNSLVKMHIDTPNAILWETKSGFGGANNHHFVATVKVGEKNLLCRNKGYGQFSKAQAEALLKTCQSAKK